jgi:hypothetical protein
LTHRFSGFRASVKSRFFKHLLFWTCREGKLHVVIIVVACSYHSMLWLIYSLLTYVIEAMRMLRRRMHRIRICTPRQLLRQTSKLHLKMRK